MSQLITNQYLSNLFRTFKKGDSREESFYKHLADFLTTFSEVTNNNKIDITILPKKTEGGNPDFRIWDGAQKIIGYIEAKYLSIDLDKIEDTEQIKRYLSTFPNVILTNFTEFRLYRNGLIIDRVVISRPFIIRKLLTSPVCENEKQLFDLLAKFLDFSLPQTFTAKTLAIELAKRTKFLKDEIIKEELKLNTKSIHGFYEAFKEFLIAGINEDEFSDLYSQTITYGLFAARLRAGKDFNRKLAFSYIPKSIGILRDVFKFISLDDLPPHMEVIIDDIAEVLSVADARKILDKYYHEGKGNDPVLHFYETFLSVYSPETREKRGVYYTPEPVVSFMVRSIHQILKVKFNISDGLASNKVTLLDPAGGTLGFLAKAIEVAVEEFKSKYGEGAIKTFLKEQILQNFYSFELMMAPYAIGHMKMSFLLEELGYRMEDEERIKYYLTNTLEMDELEESKFPGMSSLSTESHEAGKVKKQTPIIVVLGNPPYSGISSNNGKWIREQIETYKYVDGEHFKERKHWLQDDYVKFIRFSQWKIDQAGEGVLAFITNHSYLDNPTFRGMRQSLLKSFDEIYILDLHGNSIKKEKSLDGSKDENVFDIQQGVAISFFIKNRKKKSNKIVHHELYGLRELKYNWLEKHSIDNIRWKKISPNSPYYFLIPKEEKYSKTYYKYFSLQDIFPINVTGIVTARDSFVIDIDKNSLKRRIEEFRSLLIDDISLIERYNLKDTRGWKFKNVRKELAKDKDWDNYFHKILYRPFDIRHIYYSEKMVDWGRNEVMRNMLEENISLCFMRQVSSSESFTHALVSEYMVDNRTFFSSKGIIQQAPLYIYPDKKEKKKNPLNQFMIFEPEIEYPSRYPNINSEIFKLLKKNFGIEISPEEIFYYIYSILYSNIYREKYGEFLKIDFPRIPFINNYNIFLELVDFGNKLADLHLLRFEELDNSSTKFSINGNNKIERIKYTEEKVWINTNQFFGKIRENIWTYQIGGYQICEKWLKDRKNLTLSVEEIKYYCKITTTISQTIELQNKIDSIITSHI